jgi:phage terminase large subunit-like protein
MRFIGQLRMPDTDEPARLAAFQRLIVRATYRELLTVASIPSGNGKTTLMGLLGLERICRGDRYARVVVLATKKDQAREVVEAAKAIAECDERLVERMAWYEDDATLLYRPTGATLVAHSARLRSIEGLRYRLALIDEIGFALDELVTSIVARLGKGTLTNRILGMGTPGFEPNVLHRIREMHRNGGLPAGATYLEWAAPEGCALDDEAAWREANPAIGGGFLSPFTRELQLGLMPERQFRVYHLGQWTEAELSSLPPGAWDGCPHVDAPPDGVEVVLAVAGTWTSSVAVVGASFDGALFMVWSAETATDDELDSVLAAASGRWQLAEVVFAPRQRAKLVAKLTRSGEVDVHVWPNRVEVEVTSSTEWRRAIVEGRIAHDHDPVLAAHLGATVGQSTPDASLRFVAPGDGRPVEAARAARMAWWRAVELAEAGPVAPVIVWPGRS